MSLIVGVSQIDPYALSERLMQMDDSAWARHANPLSVYSRFSALPFLTLAIWSRDWLGWWCLLPLMAALFWIWWNPRAFAAPVSTDSWAAHGTFGERVFLNRHRVSIPDHHARWAHRLTWVSAAGIVPWVYGLWTLNLSATVLGIALIVGGKVWFVDRMVWLYQDMKDADPTYSSWLR